jgi:hypothetical protein
MCIPAGVPLAEVIAKMRQHVLVLRVLSDSVGGRLRLEGL